MTYISEYDIIEAHVRERDSAMIKLGETAALRRAAEIAHRWHGRDEPFMSRADWEKDFMYRADWEKDTEQRILSLTSPSGQTLLDQHDEEREAKFAAMVTEMSSAMDDCDDVPEKLISAFERIAAMGGGALDRHDEELLRPIRELAIEMKNQWPYKGVVAGDPLYAQVTTQVKWADKLLAALPTTENANG
jgi:hypothetical protein